MTYSARSFNHDLSRAKRDAEGEVVIVTDRGVPSHALLSYAEYRRLTSPTPGLATLLSADDDVELEPAPSDLRLGAADL
ncbi:type II toxin-antitoxin system prevent-host-death family antitoxin [Paraoerskovia marina]|uniref:type II toxin-antitoxin system prevent-host-death family antitoxin n=1 Tax=Paraoerskovia marina TaxID=545619 RepID=UPI001B805DA5|nr:type II toxin-antitoxin system prevent-host-death family antitoxin [Paraoerskovia marina]